MLRKLGFLSLVIATSVGVAKAADMPVKAPPLAAAPAVANWTGFYLGVSAGGFWDRVDGSFVNPPPATWAVNDTRGTLGAFAGAQYQFQNNIVLGVEANGLAVLSSRNGSDGCHPAASCAPTTSQFTDHFHETMGTVGGRLGYAVGYWLPYLAGGWATTKVDMGFGPTVIPTMVSTTREDGYYFGGGVDWKATKLFVVGLEYRHYDFRSVTATPVFIGGGPVPGNTWTVHPKADALSIRFSWLFGAL